MYLTTDDIIEHVRKLLADRKKTQKQYAAELGVAETFLGDVLNKRRPLGPLMLKRLGYDATPYYRRAKG